MLSKSSSIFVALEKEYKEVEKMEKGNSKKEKQHNSLKQKKIVLMFAFHCCHILLFMFINIYVHTIIEIYQPLFQALLLQKEQLSSWLQSMMTGTRVPPCELGIVYLLSK